MSTSPALSVLRRLALGCLACAWSAAPAATDPFIRAADHAAASLKPSTPFNWGEGVLTWGLAEAARATKDARYREAVERWADARCAKSLLPLLRKRGYCGHWGPGTALLALYRQNPRPACVGERAALDDAILQLEIATKHLQDEKTGLFWHMWDEKTGKHSEAPAEPRPPPPSASDDRAQSHPPLVHERRRFSRHEGLWIVLDRTG